MLKVLFFGLAFLVMITGIMQFRKPKEDVLKRFKEQEIPIDLVQYKYGKRTIRYYQTGTSNESGPLILFVHGAPGSSQDYLQFLEDKDLLKNCSMITVDRPGYGYSNFGYSLASISEQSKAIGMILDSVDRERKVMVVGHSFGGPIAAKMACDFPEKIDALLLLAPALDPREEKFITLAKISKIPPLRWLAPAAWKVAADEKTAHVRELEAMDPDWESIRCQVFHMHGTKDSLVPYQNVRISKEMMTNAEVEIITLKDVDHFLPWSNTEDIKELILKIGS